MERKQFALWRTLQNLIKLAILAALAYALLMKLAPEVVSHTAGGMAIMVLVGIALTLAALGMTHLLLNAKSSGTAPEPSPFSAPNAPSESGEAPELGSYWVGQGGIYAGIRYYPDGPHHLIVSTDDLEELAWGPTRTRPNASSRINGVLNTTTLLEAEGRFPAATAAGNYSADGRYDFYLPSIGELHQVWQYLPNLILEGTYWSSSQRSENHAFCMLFGSGYQFNYEKNAELCVRPIRRLPACDSSVIAPLNDQPN